MGESAEAEILQELAALDAMLQTARANLAQLRGASAEERGIVGATDELDAVVEATEVATGTILDSAEALLDVSGSLTGDAAAEVSAHAMSILEACNFQDITGQRISKVVQVLRHVEERIDHILQAHPDGRPSVPTTVSQREGDEALLNGPARPGDAAVDQDEIDRLLAGD